MFEGGTGEIHARGCSQASHQTEALKTRVQHTDAPKSVQQAFLKQADLLLADMRHPSLQRFVAGARESRLAVSLSHCA
jgi:hypothetical protein